MNPCIDHCYLRYGKQYSHDCNSKCEYAKAILENKALKETIAIATIHAQHEVEELWHDAKENPPKNPGLYYGKQDDTNCMWLCRYRDGVWTLDAYPEQKREIVKWAEYTLFNSDEGSEVKTKDYAKEVWYGEFPYRVVLVESEKSVYSQPIQLNELTEGELLELETACRKLREQCFGSQRIK